MFGITLADHEYQRCSIRQFLTGMYRASVADEVEEFAIKFVWTIADRVNRETESAEVGLRFAETFANHVWYGHFLALTTIDGQVYFTVFLDESAWGRGLFCHFAWLEAAEIDRVDDLIFETEFSEFNFDFLNIHMCEVGNFDRFAMVGVVASPNECGSKYE